MDKLPPEILIRILSYVECFDIEAAYNTCMLWKNIIDEHKLWVKPLAEIQEKVIGERLNVSPDPIGTISRFCQMMFVNRELQKCLLGNKKNPLVGILTVKPLSAVSVYEDRLKYMKKESTLPINYPNMFIANEMKYHKHFQYLYYAYALELTPNITKDLVKHLLTELHPVTLVIVPTILLNSLNLGLSDSVMIQLEPDYTEIAVIVDASVCENRWLTIPIKKLRYIKNETSQDDEIVDYDSYLEKRIFKHRVALKYFQKLDLANNIFRLLQNLDENKLSCVLYNVTLIDIAPNEDFYAAKLQLDLITLFPNISSQVRVKVGHSASFHGYFQTNVCTFRNTPKYVPGELYTITRNQYLESGLEGF